MFSVVIPTLNRSDRLAKALGSVLAQTGERPEIIVVDDGSGAEEAAKIAAVAATAGARLIRLDQNVGASAARNTGVQAASGEWIAFLDSDDWWLPNRLARHRDALADPAVVLSYNRVHITRGGEEGRCGTAGRDTPPGWRLPVALAGWNYVGGCSMICVRRDAFLAAGGFDTHLLTCEDWDLWLRLTRAGRFAFLDQPLGYNDIGPHARLTTSKQKIVDGHEHMFRAADAFAQTRREKRYVNAVHEWVRAEIDLMFGDGRGARRALLRSLVTRPTIWAVKRAPSMIAQSMTMKIAA